MQHHQTLLLVIASLQCKTLTESHLVANSFELISKPQWLKNALFDNGDGRQRKTGN